jgi:hypothetical protein
LTLSKNAMGQTGPDQAAGIFWNDEKNKTNGGLQAETAGKKSKSQEGDGGGKGIRILNTN